MRLTSAVVAFLLGAIAANALYTAKSPVVQLTPANFDEEVLKFDGVVFVELYAPWCGFCKKLAPDWEKAAKALKGSVKIAAVDADAHKELGTKYNVQGFPTIKVFGADKSKPKDYDGGRDADAIVTAAIAELKTLTNARLGIKGGDEAPKKDTPPPPPSGGFYDGTDVVELTDENFEQEMLKSNEAWLIEFYAPWCGHCKNLAPDWKKAATELSGTMKIGAINADAQKALGQRFKVNGFPTIKFFAPGSEEGEDYNGGRSAQAIVDYCTQKAELYPGKPVVVTQAENDDSLAACYKKTMCVVFIVPHVLDTGAYGRNKYISMFNDIAGKMRSRGVAFHWIAGGDHSKFEEGFGIHATYPTFVAVNAQRKRYATHKGRFDAESIMTGIKKILDGKTGVTQLPGDLPKLSKGVALWDGKDYVAPADE